MELNIDGVSIFYKRYFGSGPVILLLHGWGVNSDIFDGVFGFFESLGLNVISLDFPGFGKSGEPSEGWGIYDYAETINKFITELSLDKVILLGHSFGGRVALILASEYSYAEKLILVSAAGLKPKISLAKKFAVIKYKIAKRRGKDVSNFGSEDYKALSGEMKNVFVRVINEHLDSKLSDINCPTLIVWGENDLQTPLYMAKKLHKNIKGSELKILSGCNHFSFLERPQQFNIIIDNFIRR